MIKNLPAKQEAWVQSLGWVDPLEEGMATHSTILAWKNPWTEKPGGVQSMGSPRAGHYLVSKHSNNSVSLSLSSVSCSGKWTSPGRGSREPPICNRSVRSRGVSEDLQLGLKGAGGLSPLTCGI